MPRVGRLKKELTVYLAIHDKPPCKVSSIFPRTSRQYDMSADTRPRPKCLEIRENSGIEANSACTDDAFGGTDSRKNAMRNSQPNPPKQPENQAVAFKNPHRISPCGNRW
jgi:hypothetical protein